MHIFLSFYKIEVLYQIDRALIRVILELIESKFPVPSTGRPPTRLQYSMLWCLSCIRGLHEVVCATIVSHNIYFRKFNEHLACWAHAGISDSAYSTMLCLENFR